MKNSFMDDMNRVKATETLKDNTAAFVRTELVKAEYERTSVVRTAQTGKEKPFMRKLIGAISAVAACALIAVGGYVFYNTPLSYVSFDVNPSVELGINAFDRVVSALAYNDDGEQLLSGLDIAYTSLGDAISDLVSQADEQGYIMEDGSTIIAVTAESNNEQTAAQIQSTCEECITLTLNKGETTAVVYTDAISLQFAQQARESGVSPGKYRLIEVLQSLDSTVTVAQYQNAKISEIIAAASDLLDETDGNNGNGSGSGNAANADALQKIRSAALKAQSACGECDQTQAQTQTMTLGASGETNTEQNQNANQGETSQATEQEQETNGNSAAASNAASGNGNSGSNGKSQNSECSEDCSGDCSSDCMSDCSSNCSSDCTSDSTGAQSDNGSSNAGGNSGNG